MADGLNPAGRRSGWETVGRLRGNYLQRWGLESAPAIPDSGQKVFPSRLRLATAGETVARWDGLLIRRSQVRILPGVLSYDNRRRKAQRQAQQLAQKTLPSTPIWRTGWTPARWS